jgi:hypothetical protein
MSFGGNCMKSTILALAALACSFSVMAANTPSQSMDQFCADRASIKSVKELTSNSDNLMAFANRGGIGNGGVCWWHSRMQRNALYLTIYKPAEQVPTVQQAKEIVEKLRAGKEIVTIPGFSNFADFSSAYRPTIQRELEKWQKGDGILKFNWVIGLSGSSSVDNIEMYGMMNELYDYVENEGNIAYQKLQIKGVVAHAWLVINMKKIGDDGYDLEVLDSNFPHQTTVYKYRMGMTHFNHYAYGEFVPYLERKGEMDRVTNVILKKCNPEEYEKRKGKERKDTEGLKEKDKSRLSKN